MTTYKKNGIAQDSDKIYKCEIEHGIKKYSRAIIQLDSSISISRGDEISIEDNYTTQGATTSAVIFEGVVDKIDKKYPPTISIESKARELDAIRPSGTYSGSTDEIIYQLISDYCDYVILNLVYDATYTTDFSTEDDTHYGTYDFKNVIMEENNYWGHKGKEALGGTGNGWNLTTYASHIDCNEAVNYATATYSFNNAESTGDVEFWINFSNINMNGYSFFGPLNSAGSKGFGISTKNNKFAYCTALATWTEFGSTISANTWYHIRLSYDCTAGTCYVYVNGVSNGPYNFLGGADDFDIMLVQASDASSTCRIDAIGHTGSTYGGETYYVGENKNKYNLGNLKNTVLNDDEIKVDESDTNRYVKMNSSLDGHGNVLEFYDNDGTYNVATHILMDSAETSGTIEFWIRSDDVTLASYFNVYDDATQVFGFRIDNDKFQYYDGSWNDSAGVGTPSDDTWYHVRIDFECGAGGYQGLAADKWTFYINGTEQSSGDLDFGSAVDDINILTLETDDSDSGYSMFIDAISYSWDTESHANGYNIGDNTNNNSVENFKTEDDGFFFENNFGGFVSALGVFSSHGGVIKLEDTSASGNALLIHDLNGDQTYGSIEFWIQTSDVTKECNMMCYHGSTAVFGFQIDGTAFNYWKDDSSWAAITGCGTPANDTWYRVTIDFECTSGSYQSLAQYDYTISINGTEATNGDFNMDSNEAHVDTIKFYTGTTDTTYDMYIDAIGYTWDSEYDRGDNASLLAGGVETGTSMGSITFGGDKTLRTIIDEYANLDQFIWYLNPTGTMYYNSGANDSGVDIDEDSGLWNVNAEQLIKGINKVIILGGIQTDGTQAYGEDDDLVEQAANGIIIYKDTDASLRSDALCDDKAEAILTNVQDPPLQVFYSKAINSSVGYILCGENITFAYNTNEMPTISSDQYILFSMIYNPVHGIYDVRIINGLYFVEKGNQELVQENSQLIQQNTQNIEAQSQGGNLPIGTILMFKGNGIKGGDTSNILTRTDEISIDNGDDFDMQGWYVCNGYSSTPNLHDRFIRCELDSAGGTVTGGADTVTLDPTEMPYHTHTYYRSSAGAITAIIGCCGGFYYLEALNNAGYAGGSGGVTQPHNNMPSYFSVVFIIKMS